MLNSAVQLLMCSAKPGVSKAQVLEATRITNAVLRRMPGYVEHEIAFAAADGYWIDLVHWTDHSSAQAAKDAFRRQPEAEAIAAVIEQYWLDFRPGDVLAGGLVGVSVN